MSHEWEMCKENVIPIKKGRAVQDCSNPVKPSQNSDLAFEGIIQENLSNAEGLLSAYVQYYTWIRRRAGDNKASSKALLERATNDLLRFKQLSNNIQYIKLWIEYADLVSDPNDVFSFMQSNSVGVKLSLFWIAWAFVAEKSQNYQLADRIFQNGQCENAEPKSLLAQRYQQFQRRITRKYLTAMENGETFAPLNSMSSATTTAFVPSSKPVLSSIPVAPSSSNASSFAVFTDFDDNNNSLLPATSLPKKQQRSFLANENQRLKENIGMVEKWTNPILPQTAANPVNNNSSILIFTDPDLAPPNQQPVKSASFIPIFDDSQASSTPVTSNTKDTTTDVNHNDKATFSIPVDVPESIVSEQQPMKHEEDAEDHTINTKLALEDIEKMFTEEDFFASEFSNEQVSGSSQKKRMSHSPQKEEDDEFVDLDEYLSSRRRKMFMRPSLPNHNPIPLTISSKITNNNQHDDATNHCGQEFSRIFTSQQTNFNYNSPLDHISSKSHLKAFSPSTINIPNEMESIIMETTKETAFVNLNSESNHGELPPLETVHSTNAIVTVREIKEEQFACFQRRYFETQRCSASLKNNDTSLHVNNLLSQINRRFPSFCRDTVSWQGVAWRLHSVLAKGKFGLAVRLVHTTEGETDNRSCVMKVDKEGYSVHWEHTIHALIANRMEMQVNSLSHLNVSWLATQEIQLFRDCAAVCMPYVGSCTLLSVLQLMHKRHFDVQEQEVLAAVLTLQMLLAVQKLHALHLLHCDIKTDNWVLQSDASLLRVLLIDFGKARPLRMSVGENASLLSFFGEDSVYTGKVSARVYRSSWENSDQQWSYGVDYYGLCCCVHQLLHLDELQTARFAPQDIEKRGYDNTLLVSQGNDLTLPISSLRRYWHKHCWALLFATLLNPPLDLRQQADLDLVVDSFQSFLCSKTNVMEVVQKKLYLGLRSVAQFL